MLSSLLVADIELIKITKIYKVATLQPTDNEALQSENLYSGEADKKTIKPWDYAAKEYDYTAADANQEAEETKAMSGFKTVMHAVSHIVFSASTLSIYSILRGVQWGKRVWKAKKAFDNLTEAALSNYQRDHEGHALTFKEFREMPEDEREELINYGKNHNNAEEVHLSEEIESKAAVDGSDQQDDKSVENVLIRSAEILDEEESEL